MSAFDGKRVLVVGLGVSGFATARVLAERGARVRVTEQSSGGDIEQRAEQLRSAGVEVETGGHDLSGLDADVAIVSPGIPPDAPVIQALDGAGIRMISEIEAAFRLAECEFLAVTGTNGKTTTTSLLAAMLAEAGLPSLAAGNIGLPLVEAVARVGRGGAVAVEVSSFQLEGIESFRPRVAVLLNVAEDHTDWHGSFDAYVRAKARLIENQRPEDVFLPNDDDPRARSIAGDAAARVVPFSARRAPADGIGVDGARVLWRGRPVFAAAEVPGPGLAMLEDAVAAAGAALEFGVDPDSVARAVAGFRPLRHRLELVAENGGVRYVDDSKATNPHATISAVRGMTNVVLLAGGRSKGIDLSPLAETVPPVVGVVALGEAAPQIERTFEGLVPVARAGSMSEGVRAASELAKPPATVLLSPGCASLDMYESYARRGDDFARAVRDLLSTDEARRGHAGR